MENTVPSLLKLCAREEEQAGVRLASEGLVCRVKTTPEAEVKPRGSSTPRVCRVGLLLRLLTCWGLRLLILTLHLQMPEMRGMV